MHLATQKISIFEKKSLKLTFLGTGTSQGVPVIGCECDICRSADVRDKRLRTAVLIEVHGKNILIDAGPDFRQQMLRENVKRLDAIIFTHEHKDHIGGLDDVRAYNFLNQSPMDIYAEQRVQMALRREYSYVFSDNKYPGVPQLMLHDIDEKAFEVFGIKIIPIRVMHYRLPILGFRIGNLTYITDANYIADEERNKIFGTKHLVINALRKEKHISHYTLDEALEFARSCAPQKTYITHLSHHMGLHEEVNRELPPGVCLAYDGLQIEIT